MLNVTFALLAFLLPLAYSPGPGNLFFAANGARFGLRATLPANFGYHVATLVVSAAIGLGFFAAIDRLPGLFDTLRVAGALYVLWLAWKLFRAGALAQDAEARPAGFVDGAVLLLLNPKAYVIMALMFTQFLGDSATGSALVLWIALIFTLNNALAFTLWTVAGDGLGRLFRSPERARVLNVGLSAMLAAVAVWMLAA